MEQILEFLASPLAKVILLNVGGWILKTWPPFVNKAIPVALLLVSALYQMLVDLWPGLVPDAHAAVILAAGGGLPWWKAAGIWLGNVGLPVIIAVGLHSTSKNVREWASLGNGLLKR